MYEIWQTFAAKFVGKTPMLCPKKWTAEGLNGVLALPLEKSFWNNSDVPLSRAKMEKTVRGRKQNSKSNPSLSSGIF